MIRSKPQAKPTLVASVTGAVTYKVTVKLRSGPLVAEATAYVDSDFSTAYVYTRYGAHQPGLRQVIRTQNKRRISGIEVASQIAEWLLSVGDDGEKLVFDVEENVNFSAVLAAA